jgi:microcystin-dependent protein
VFPTVPVINGYFNVILGPVETDANGVALPAGDSINDAFTGGLDCYLEVQVDAEPMVIARQRILSAPYAVQAERALLADNGVPPGTVLSFAGVTPPVGYLLCDGSAVSRTTYSALFASIGIIWGAGDGSTTFNLPDLRGMFLRGAGQNGDTEYRYGGDDGRTVGSLQQDLFENHNHSFPVITYNEGTVATGWHKIDSEQTFTKLSSVTVSDTGGEETRSKNSAMNFIITY